jgi:hypothetical protein
MKLKNNLCFYLDETQSIEWLDKIPLNYNGIKLGKIIKSEFNKNTGQIDITFKIFKSNINKVKKLIDINK